MKHRLSGLDARRLPLIGSSRSGAIKWRQHDHQARRMKRIAALVIALLAAATVVTPQGLTTWPFDADQPNVLPTGFTLTAMRQESPGTWLVRRDGTNGHLVHALGTGTGYAMALAPHDPLADVIVSARLRLAGGVRAGGVVWRHQDANNFYAAVLDLTQGTLFMYLIRGGNRITVESEDDLELDPAAWHTLRVVHERATVYVSLGGIRVFEEREGRLERTFGPGRVGLLSTGDSEVWFDDLRVEPGRVRR
jgi:hypothetical protein